MGKGTGKRNIPIDVRKLRRLHLRFTGKELLPTCSYR